ncbi:MAG: RlmE family RNA methyltransferase [Deltaproteobacteria bacterium]|nr:RlmE family RNA methyltransferase [Deltaproteobacteria bacterium]
MDQTAFSWVNVGVIKRSKWDDHYALQARKEHRLARSVYKLEEIDKKYGLIRPQDRILDLGCYPGSWSLYCLKKVGSKGEVVGMDLKQPKGLSAPNFRFLKADILGLDIEWLLREVGPRDTIISDLAPQTTGIAVTDTARSLSLAEEAFRIALALLRKGGNFFCKIFEGEDLKTFREGVLRKFGRGRTVRPTAVRKASREVYLLGLGLKE